jgi:cation transport ATPase
VTGVVEGRRVALGSSPFLAELGVDTTALAGEAEALRADGATAILMTEKDAVKCERFADDRCWALPVRATVEPALIALVERGLRGRKTA